MGTTMISSLSFLDKETLSHDLKDFYIPYRDSLDLPKDSTFGIEIEFKMPGFDNRYVSNFIDCDCAAESFMKENNYNNIWDVCYEEQDHIEIVSDVLTDKKRTWDDLNNVLNNIKENGAYYSGACGAHVHVGRHLLGCNVKSWLTFFKTWSIFEDIIFKFTNGEHHNIRSNFYNRSKSVRELFMDLIDRYRTSNGDRDSLLLDKTRCINIEQTYVSMMAVANDKFNNEKENTIEFRCPNGTLNQIIWQNNINFFTKLMLACSSDNYDFELVDYIYERIDNLNDLYKDDLAFILPDLIFNNDFDKYCFLRQYYKDFDEPKDKDPLLLSKPFWK